MIDKIGHYSISEPATVYDEEALTAVKLAARTAAKVNECIDEVNTIPEKVEDEFEKNLDDGTFDAAIDKYAGDIKTRVENILGGIPTNPTALDAEVVDIRLGADGTTYGSAGKAVRNQFLSMGSKVDASLRVKLWTKEEYDLNNILELGCFYLSSYYDWKNTPQGMSNAGLLIVISEGVQMHKTQIFINGQGIAHRSQFITEAGDGSFSEWEVGASLEDIYNIHGIINEELPYKYMNFKEISNAGTVDLNNITDIGCYMFGSSHTLTNAPARIGMLLVYKGKQEHNVYQEWHSYDGKIYTRNFIYNEGFTPWVRILTEDDIELVNPSNAEKYNYKVWANGKDTLHVLQYGKRSNIRYDFKRMNNAYDGLDDSFGIRGVYLIDKTTGIEKIICGQGVDIDGVMKYEDEENHVGGVHGREFIDMISIHSNGLDEIDESNFQMTPVTYTDHIRIQSDSMIIDDHSQGTGDELARRFMVSRIWTFDENGLTINNEYHSVDDAWQSDGIIRAGMLSIPTSMIDTIYTYEDTTGEDLPIIAHIHKPNPTHPSIIPDSGVTLGPSYENVVKFTGEITAELTTKIIYYGGDGSWYDAGEQDATTIKLTNYGDRIKAYITSGLSPKIMTKSTIKFIM